MAVNVGGGFNKLSRDNFTEIELNKIVNALNCTFKINDTGEEI